MRKDGRSTVTIEKAVWPICPVNDAFGDRPIRAIRAIRAPEILSVLRKVEARGECVAKIGTSTIKESVIAQS